VQPPEPVTTIPQPKLATLIEPVIIGPLAPFVVIVEHAIGS